MRKLLLAAAASASLNSACAGVVGGAADNGASNDAAPAVADAASPDAFAADAAPVPDSGGPPDSGPRAPDSGLRGFGFVTVDQRAGSGASLPSFSASAAFFFGPVPESNCPMEQMGACTVYQCATQSSTTPPNASLMSAGNIMISGGDKAPITLAPDVNGTYSSSTGTGRWFRDGAMLHIQAVGTSTGVASFDAMVPAASTVSLTAPIPPVSGTLIVDRSRPLIVAWASVAGAAGDVSIIIYGSDHGGLVLQAVCAVPISQGSLEIGSLVLGGVSPGPGTLTMIPSDSAQIIIDGVAITLGTTAPWVHVGAPSAIAVQFN